MPWPSCIALAVALFTAPAHAGISIVDDGASGTPARILLHGPIAKGDSRALEQALDRIRGTVATKVNDVPLITVELDSPGGDVVEALDIGRTIYQNFLMTLVRPGHECVSACVFVLMAGAVHTAADGASIGLHKPLLVTWYHMDSSQAHAKFDGLMAYLREYFTMLGVSGKAYDLMMTTSPYDMRYFSNAELDQLRLRGEDPAWEKLYGAKWAADNAPRERPAITVAELPKLPPVDQSFRAVVFMPPAYHRDIDYMAGTGISKLRLVWASLDDDQLVWTADAPDIIGLLRRARDAVMQLVRPVWWLLLLGAVELLRARPWPDDGDRPGRRDQWRLKSFR